MKDYFVLYARDRKAPELEQNVYNRELYDKIEFFANAKKAYSFAEEHLHDAPIVAKKIRKPLLATEYHTEKLFPYVVAGHFDEKYVHHYFEITNSVPTYEIERTGKKNLETTIRRFSDEGADRLICGVELKLVP